jgi:hypothetical protein
MSGQIPGSRLADVIGSPDIGEGHAKIFADWTSNLLPNDLPLSRLHAKFWGKSMVDDEHEWRKSQPVAEECMDDGEDALMAGIEDEVMEATDGDEEEAEDEEDEDLIPGCYFLDMSVAGIEPSIWIRADYIRIYDRLEAHYAKVGSRGRAPAAVLTGQPGIGEWSSIIHRFMILVLKSYVVNKGKSIWIYYALRRRLAEKHPVLWLWDKQYYLFVEEGVYQAPHKFGKTNFHAIVWTLVDSNESNEGVPESLIVHGTRLFVIYSTSPRRKRWKSMTQTVVKITLIMNPWTRKELFRV